MKDVPSKLDNKPTTLNVLPCWLAPRNVSSLNLLVDAGAVLIRGIFPQN